jgi:quercetin dioxygenase-like cupin family protein
MQSRSKQVGFVRSSNDVEELEMDGGARIRWLITHKEGAPTFSMRLITVDEGKSTPTHSHDYEHEIFVIEGKLSVQIGSFNQDAPVGAYIYIPPNEIHGMRALKDSKIICIVPIKAAILALGE